MFSSLEVGTEVQNPRLSISRYNTVPSIALFAIAPAVSGDLQWRLAEPPGDLVCQDVVAII